MPYCNDPVKAIVKCNDAIAVEQAMFQYGVVDNVRRGKTLCIVTFAWWNPTGIGAQMRCRLQNFEEAKITIGDTITGIIRYGKKPETKAKYFTIKDPYNKEALIKTVIPKLPFRREKKGVDVLYN